MTTTEKLARAMGDVHLDFQEEPLSMNATKDDLHRLARAILTALLTPTEAMIDAAAETPGMQAVASAVSLQSARGYPLPDSAIVGGLSPLEQAWRAMVLVARDGLA